ncbi:cytochrome o ubiquinol oxidase subunit IV [Vibrio europaeus]|uniref:Cytochrome bo(3) ubiquinol oxidase subunit 4 n=1 Tax=Vibrio europaeus TaxID=300876 RepID=A0A178JFY9_9VIBR|nr:cytochrome o ubiquinol oxidase subunit IV [Vibrio europaeus]MDC5707272.1 cytochrome o ubiquinol oxidase subunit IV [Vibrio europaeus]MDC5712637.1 cytochrome o ubiquinol oxidase subunit IV [Vibrio europaeus]MDC5717280.1 cytochrome o ubiquinol oxidase subunit IV [Vibrio europaeus]MDC5721186.1 cytochrome o ubiquinol oxidase subunit IV [Vibrio europaeus]MDC5726580.1 cytochrome o ubiquinol oxidase subunit IV [Vibrio europaeus]
MEQYLETGASDYVKGFVASLILTVIPFYFVWAQSLPDGATYVILFGCAIVQIFVHFRYFLHMEAKTSDGRWNLVSLMFTAIVVLILIAGSVWIIYNMNVNMKL